jgi:hypothetical protein
MERAPIVEKLSTAVCRDGNQRDDPAVGAFLAFFAKHIQRHPEQLHALTPEFARSIVALADRVEVVPDRP